MDFAKLELMLGEERVLTEKEAAVNVEGLANVAQNAYLKRLIEISQKAKIIEALGHLAAREFEEAFACLKAYEAVVEMEQQLSESVALMERAKETDPAVLVTPTIRY